MKLHFNPPFLPLQTAAIALIVLGIAFTLYTRWELRQRARRNLRLLALRGGIVLLLAFILLNPVLTLPAPETQAKRPLMVLLDTSRSMNTADMGGETGLSRWKAVRRAVLENPTLFDTLQRTYDVRLYGFDERVNAATAEAMRHLDTPDGDGTSIGEALTQAVSTNAPPAENAASTPGVRGGILLVSDGRDNGTTYPLDSARAARAMGFPIFTVCVGQETKTRDMQVAARRPQSFAAPGQSIELTAEIDDDGLPGAPVHVDLLREGKRIASRNVVLETGRRDVSFPVTEERKGFYRYALVCSVVPGQTNETNNRANVFLNVMDSRARVLLMEGHPSWDSKFLAQSLRSDPTITIDCLYKLTPTRPFALSGSADKPTLSIPRTVEDFAHYDVVIFGKGYEEFFDAAATDALKKWVAERGGNVVFLRGKAHENTPALQELEPVAFGDDEIAATRVRLTEAGRSHPGFAFEGTEDAQTVVQKLPSLISATRVKGEKALSVVLARAQPSGEGGEDARTQAMAMLAYQRYGQGKTMAVVGQGLWQWAFPPPDMAQYAHVYDEFWAQTIRWLVSESDFLPGQNIALHTDKTAYSSKDAVNLLGYLRGTKPAVLPVITITAPDGSTSTVASAKADGRAADFVATFRPSRPGEYVATVPPPPGSERAAPASATFTVYAGQQEDANRSADPVLMRQIAAAGGGQVLEPSELDSLPERLRAAELAAQSSTEPRTAWDRGWVLFLLLSLLTAEWLLRRRLGLA